MKISCCMITTNVKNRLTLLDDTVKSISNLGDSFDEKIMSVDMFNDGADISHFDKFKSDNWNIIHKPISPKSSMVLNQKQVLDNASSEVVFYTEDDIIINTLPKNTTIDKLFNSTIINNKQVGFICYNTHIFIEYWKNNKEHADFINDINNYVTIDGDTFLIKNDTIKDKYYLNFPVSITKKEIFLNVQDFCFKNGYKMGVESAMSAAWFNMGYNDKYEVLIYVKNGIIEKIKSGEILTITDFFDYSNMNFWNNDEKLRHASIDNKWNSTVF